MSVSFEEQLKNDVDDIFLQEFSKSAIFKTNTSITDVKIQFFYGDLDKLETLYTYCWGKYKDFSYVKKNDILVVDNIQYGVVDYAHDEFKQTTTLFLDKV